MDKPLKWKYIFYRYREHLLLGFFTLVVLCIYKKKDKEYDVSDDSYLFLKLFILVVSFLM